MIDLVRQEVVRGAHTLVVKIGTNVLARPRGGLDLDQVSRLAEQVARAVAAGRKVVLVSSGAIGAGLGRLKLSKRPTSLPELQAVAAIGQTELMKAWEAALGGHGLVAAQILLTADDFDDRSRYLNARNCILELLRRGAVPIINENDTVSVAEIRFGDNDQLAAMVTNLLRAPLLVVLSVVDGLYRGDVLADPTLEPIDVVLDIESVLGLAGASTSGLGTGGMRSKLQAAKLATAAGESVWIANGRLPDVLDRILAGERLGTLLPSKGESVASWKRWIGYTVRPRGAYIVDDGAQEALCRKRRSLLPVGVVDLRGDFNQGDVVAIENQAGKPFARGLTNYSAKEARCILGKPSKEVARILPAARYEELVHRDHLVLLD